jgi:hypothetical protein
MLIFFYTWCFGFPSCVLGLNSYIITNESYFELPKVTFKVLCNSKCSIVCMGFVATGVVKKILFSMSHGVGCYLIFVGWFVYSHCS